MKKKRLLVYLAPYWGIGLILLFCVIITVAAKAAIPWQVQQLIDWITSSVNSNNAGLMLKGLSAQSVLLVAIYITKGIFMYGQSYAASYLGNRLAVDLRMSIYRHLQRLSLDFHESKRTGEIMSWATNDVNTVQVAITNGIVDLFSQSLLLAVIMVMVFALHWKLALVTLILLPTVGLIIGRMGRRIKSITSQVQAKIADITSLLQETLTGIRIIKAFTMEKYEIERFSRENESSFAIGMKGARIGATIVPIVELVGVIGLTGILWYGGREVILGNLSVGQLVAFMGLVGMTSSPASNLGRVYQSVQQGIASFDRIMTLFEVEPNIYDTPSAINIKSCRGLIEFEDISFSYSNDKMVLDDVNLRVEPGTTVALVGPSGAGKTTMVNLIPRFYDPDRGSIKLDGTDIRRFKIESLRKQIGMVPQETVLFGATVAENIAYGNPNATKDEIINASIAANAHDFIKRLPSGYDTYIGEKGVSLSGGQRQRIAIARAILRNPKILIFDEATSALDAESENLVQEAIFRLLKGRTTFIIAHRLSTIKNADMIVVLEEGSIVEVGNHSSLLASGGLYSKLYGIQFATQEVV